MPLPYCIIGAGPCGLTAAKNLRAAGIACEVFEREDDVGGNWYYGRPSSSVYASTHMISSKRLTEYTDFPMPKAYPPYPSHAQALAYLRDYARHFGLYESITFGTSVVRAEPLRIGWRITLSTGETRDFAGLVVANGHHWDPLLPELPGNFTGEVLHAHNYKTPEVLFGKRVLVIGAGNSGCDLAVEAGQFAAATFHSFRRGYHFLPKFLYGAPVDLCAQTAHRWWLPKWIKRQITKRALRIAVGSPERFGLPRPDHDLFETHPIINSRLLDAVGHGKVSVVPAIEKVAGDRVRFQDGREESIDLILCATGYKLSFPFLDSSLILNERGRPKLYLNAFHPERDDLFVIGMIQPNGGIWRLADYQAQLMAAYLRACDSQPAKAATFRRLKAQCVEDLSGGTRYVESPRHVLEVDYFAYGDRLRKLLRQFSARRPLGAPPGGGAAPSEGGTTNHSTYANSSC